MNKYLPLDMTLVVKAMKIAERAHKGQTRRVSGEPYYHHVLAVMMIVLGYKKSKHLTEMVCAAILHDTLEDTSLTFEKIAKEFGPLTASLVFELSNDEKEIKRVGKLAYHKAKLVGISSYALVIKLADRLHNISDNPSEKMVKETLELMTHLRKNRKFSKTQLSLVCEIQNVCGLKA